MAFGIRTYFDTFPLIIAHRGASRVKTENSAGAIREALDSSADMIEVDLRTTKDEYVILFHDRDTGRLAGTKKVINESTLEELDTLRLKGGESIITLSEALQIVKGGKPLNLELKSRGSGRKLAAFLEKNPYRGLLIVSSFLPAELDDFKGILPDVPTSALFEHPSLRDIAASRQRGHLSINVNVNYLDDAAVAKSHKERIALFVYTVDDRHIFVDLAHKGISGFFTNDPASMAMWRDSL